MCPRTEGDIGVFFQVQNLNTNTGFDLGDDNCYLRLSNLIDGCSRGGEDIIAGWHSNKLKIFENEWNVHILISWLATSPTTARVRRIWSWIFDGV
jgi:hypothetical protein